jgi:cytochrome c oxidase subunit I
LNPEIEFPGDRSSTRRLAGAWFLLALVALGISALLAIVLVAARTPFLGLGGRFFRTALVLHVDMAVLVWFLAAAAGLWSLSRDRAGAFGWGVFWLAAGSVALLLLSSLLGSPPPVLANYIPVLDSSLFHAALAGFFIAILLAGGWGVIGVEWFAQPTWIFACRWSSAVVGLAVTVFILDFLVGPRGHSVVPLTFDDQIWGAGHLLQFVHATLLLGVWSILGERFVSSSKFLQRTLPFLLAAVAAPALAGIALAVMFDVGSEAHRQGFTDLMRWASWPALIVSGAGFFVVAVRRSAGGLALNADEKGLLLSVALFALGCAVGAIIQGNATTLVPAHYHGTVGAVTLAYLLVSLRLATWFGLPVAATRALARLPLVYGLGIALLVAGLAWAGLAGSPRKSPHEELALEAASYLAGMGLAGVGGFVALLAVALFVARIVANAWSCRLARATSGRRDVRPAAILATMVAVLVGGLLFGNDGFTILEEKSSANAHVAEKKLKEIDLRFQQGIVMLHARQYDHALTAFHRVIELAPEMPEAYVNAGFALLGKGEFRVAADFFDEATTVRRDQVNAYYGLALALEGMGNRRAAVEAMRTYLHRASPDDPYRARAEAAIGEWMAALASSGPAGDPAAKH